MAIMVMGERTVTAIGMGMKEIPQRMKNREHLQMEDHKTTAL
jgi:hypothetical protein